MFGEQCTVPMTLRAPDGIIKSAAAQHSQSLEAWFMHVPGLEVVVPSGPRQAKGLLKSAIRSDNPTLYFEHKALFSQKGEVPDDADYLIPLGHAEDVYKRQAQFLDDRLVPGRARGRNSFEAQAGQNVYNSLLPNGSDFSAS